MDWFLPVVEKWIAELADSYRLPDEVRQQTLALLARLHQLSVDHRLELTIPAVDNEPLPAVDSPDERTITFTWAAPGSRGIRLMYVPVPKVIRMRVSVGEEDNIAVDNPTDDVIVQHLRALGVPQRPAEPLVIVDDDKPTNG